MTEKNRLLFVIFLLVLLIAVGILGAYYLKKKAGVSRQEQLAPTAPVPTRIEQIPFDYEVLAVSAQQATLKGEKGEATLPNNANVKIFQGTPGQALPTNFAALAVGQKLRLERTLAAGVLEVRVYIVGVTP
jgi:hypothetical protein